MKTIDFKGRPYVEVHERIKEFHKLHPKGSIRSEIIGNENGVVIIKSYVYPDVAVLEKVFTGIAYEKEGNSFINKTSFIENCETSAVGRALGFLGIGIDTSIASANEVGNAIHQQEKPKKQEVSNMSGKMTIPQLLEKESGMVESIEGQVIKIEKKTSAKSKKQWVEYTLFDKEYNILIQEWRNHKDINVEVGDNVKARDVIIKMFGTNRQYIVNAMELISKGEKEEVDF